MIFGKLNTKNYFISMAILVVGMLSVSIANVFGGYYCSVAAIEVILLTVLMYDLFDQKDNFKENIVCLCVLSLIVLFGIVFFVVNDIFNVSVYLKNDFGFFSVMVLVSQIISILSMVYLSIGFVLKFNKKFNVEIIEKEDKQNDIQVDEKEIVEQEDVEEIKKEEDEIKSISDNNIKVDVPLFEEER